VAEALVGNGWIRDITGALNIPAIVQYLRIRERVATVVLDMRINDKTV
jgi:hypothetical protein